MGMLTEKIWLPSVEAYTTSRISDFYGSRFVAAKYISCKPKPIDAVYWSHGWIAKERFFHPEVVASEPILVRQPILVANKKQEEALIGFGFEAKAIGLPYCYAQLPAGVKRIKDLVLIMPSHSSATIPVIQNQKYDEHAKDFIKKTMGLRRVVVMHQEDIINGCDAVWRRMGVEVVRGASIDDANSLVRIKALFAQAEYMITDSLSSHVPYAASEEVKIQIIEPKHIDVDLSANEFYADPRRRGPEGKFNFGYESWRRNYSFLMHELGDARHQTDWARRELGYDQVKPPKELKSLIRWGLHQRSYYQLQRVGRRVKKYFHAHSYE